MIARDPVPVPPEPDRRIAFLTTIVPSKEPIDVVRGTLQAALRIQYDGILDGWILASRSERSGRWPDNRCGSS